jgi:hypothetical protein
MIKREDPPYHPLRRLDGGGLDCGWKGPPPPRPNPGWKVWTVLALIVLGVAGPWWVGVLWIFGWLS